jgi:hypothetical protein
MIPVINKSIKLNTKQEMIRFHILVKCFVLGNYPEQSALDVLEHLYNCNGISSKEENNAFIEYCVTNKFRGSNQSVRNVLSMYTDIGLLVKPKNCIRYFKEELLPELPEEFVLNYFITNLNAVKTS